MSNERRVSPPVGLSRPGKRLWKAVTSGYELRPDELLLLENAARTVDLIAQLDDALDGAPLIVKGSMGQDREHPLMGEVRQQRALLARLLAQLKLPDELAAAVPSTRSTQARSAAQARWRMSGTGHRGPSGL